MENQINEPKSKTNRKWN